MLFRSNAENDIDADSNATGAAANTVTSMSNSDLDAIVEGEENELINQWQDVHDHVDADAGQDVDFVAANDTIGTITQAGDSQYNAEQEAEVNANASGEVLQETTGMSNSEITAVVDGDAEQVNQSAAKTADVHVDADQDALFSAGNVTDMTTIQGSGLGSLAASAASGGNYNAETDVESNSNANGSAANTTTGMSNKIGRAHV